MQKSVGEEILVTQAMMRLSLSEMPFILACVTVKYVSGQFLHRCACHTTLISTHPILAMLTISALDNVLAPRTETGHAKCPNNDHFKPGGSQFSEPARNPRLILALLLG